MNQTERWACAVDCSCRHAFHTAGYDKTDRFMAAKVSDLLLVPEVDANDVASLLAFFYGENSKWRDRVDRRPNFNIPKTELASDIKDICEYYGFDAHPDWLQNVTVADFLALDGIDEVTIPSMVRIIKHLMCGKAEPFDLTPMLLETCRKKEVAVCAELSELTWAEQDSLREEPDEESECDYGTDKYQPCDCSGGLLTPDRPDVGAKSRYNMRKGVRSPW